MRADPETEREIFAAIDALFDHLAMCRPEAALACFAADADVALYGSEVSEAVVARPALKAFLQKLVFRSPGPRFSLARREASVAGNVAWFMSDADVDIATHVPYRLTGVLDKRGQPMAVGSFQRIGASTGPPLTHLPL